MLMPIALKEVVDLLLMGPTDFSQWGMRARHIDVLLCLRVSTIQSKTCFVCRPWCRGDLCGIFVRAAIR